MTNTMHGGDPAKTSQPSGYEIDWSQSPIYTDHPEYIGKLTRGNHNRTYLNGKDIGNTRRLKTGPNGWVEIPRTEEGSNIMQYDNENGCLLTTVRYGNVVYADESKGIRF